MLAERLVEHRFVLKQSSACPRGEGQSRAGRVQLVKAFTGAPTVVTPAQGRGSGDEDCKGSMSWVLVPSCDLEN